MQSNRVSYIHKDVNCGVRPGRKRLTHRFDRVDPVHKVSFPHVDPDLEQQEPSHIRINLGHRSDSLINELAGCVFKLPKNMNLLLLKIHS